MEEWEYDGVYFDKSSVNLARRQNYKALCKKIEKYMEPALDRLSKKRKKKIIDRCIGLWTHAVTNSMDDIQKIINEPKDKEDNQDK